MGVILTIKFRVFIHQHCNGDFMMKRTMSENGKKNSKHGLNKIACLTLLMSVAGFGNSARAAGFDYPALNEYQAQAEIVLSLAQTAQTADDVGSLQKQTH